MATPQVPQHISTKYDKELDDIRAKVLTMGGLVEQQLARAIKALTEQDATLAEEVVRNDYRINRMEVAIDEECTQILVKRQPAAGDLRLVMAVTKTITDLERIGDEAERIGRVALRMMTAEVETPRAYFVGLMHLADYVHEMLHNTLDAFARMDTEAALQLAKQQQSVDEQYRAMLRQLITYMMEDPRSISRVLDVIWTVRALERIGAHTCNICEYVIYLVVGKDVRHVRIEEVEHELRDRVGRRPGRDTTKPGAAGNSAGNKGKDKGEGH